MKEYLIYTFIALFAFGIQTFLYKVSAAKKCNTALTMISFMITVSILSLSFFLYTKGEIISWPLLLFLSILNSIAFLTTTITRIEALKYIPTSVSYPIIRAGTIIVVIFSLIYFKDSLSLYQYAGILAAILVVFILYKKEDKIKNFKLGIILTIIAMFTSAAATIVQKFASLSLNKLAYITTSYVLNIFLAISIKKKLEGKNQSSKKTAFIIGFFIGICNFIGFLSILKAYSIGPLSIAAPLHDLNFVIAIILATIIYKEKLTKRRILGILLSIVSVVLLSIG